MVFHENASKYWIWQLTLSPFLDMMQNIFYLRLPLLCGWMCTQTCWLPGDSCHDGGSRISAQTKIKKRIFRNFWLNYSDKVCLSQTEAISSFDMSELQYNSRQNGQKWMIAILLIKITIRNNILTITYRMIINISNETTEDCLFSNKGSNI